MTTTATKATERLRTRSEDLLKLLVTLYVRDGREHTVREIAELTGWPEGRVRESVDALLTQGKVAYSRDSRPSFSRDYPMMVSSQRVVAVYAPSRRALRDELIRLRDETQATEDK